MGEVQPKFKKEELDAALEQLERQPFREILGDFIQSAPDPASIKKFADKSPDRWAQATTITAKLAGYNDKLEVTGTVQHVHQLSDMEISRRIRELEAASADVIELQPENISADAKPAKLLATGT